ncbi:MAG TPA: LysM domain-containing protein [Acidimicrobiales bacterium]
MAAVIAPQPRPAHTRPIPVPARPPLQVIPGGRQAARAYARRQQRTSRLHPAIYRRRRLGLALGVVTAVLVGYLALTGLRVVLGAGPAARPAATAPADATLVDAHPVVASSYVVKSGDTLWSIARSLKPTGDIRRLVDELSSRVGPGPLQAGQALSVDGLVG